MVLCNCILFNATGAQVVKRSLKTANDHSTENSAKTDCDVHWPMRDRKTPKTGQQIVVIVIDRR